MTVVYIWKPNGWARVADPRNACAANFVIVSELGDWSGFRTLEGCLAQNPCPRNNRPEGFYWIEERLRLVRSAWTWCPYCGGPTA